MLSSLPKIADKAFFIAYLFPVLLFAVSIFLLMQNYWSGLLKAMNIDPLKDSDKIENFIYFSFFVSACSIFLMLTNKILFWGIEGYCLPFKNEFLRRREISRFKSKKERLNVLAAQWRLAGDNYPENLQRECARLGRELASDFPSKESSIMPTRFGNVMRSFEDYPRAVYGADTIPLWLHLMSVLPKDFVGMIDDARTQVTCLLNIFWLSWLILLLSGVMFSLETFSQLAQVDILGELGSYQRSGAFLVGSTVSATLSYWLMVERARNWGECVKAAFDCFLPELAEKLGFDLPSSQTKQKEFWIAVSRRALFNFPIPAYYYRPNKTKMLK